MNGDKLEASFSNCFFPPALINQLKYLNISVKEAKSVLFKLKS